MFGRKPKTPETPRQVARRALATGPAISRGLEVIRCSMSAADPGRPSSSRAVALCEDEPRHEDLVTVLADLITYSLTVGLDFQTAMDAAASRAGATFLPIPARKRH